MLLLGYSVTAWLLTIVVCGLIYLLLRARKQLRYFKDRGIPGPDPILIFGNMWGAWRRPASEVENELFKKYGPIYGTFEGHRPTLTISDMELMRNILVKDFDHFMDRRVFKGMMGKIGDKFLSIVSGEEWKGTRYLVSPAFSTGKLKRMVELMGECAENLVRHFKAKNEQDPNLLIKDIYGGYTLDVISTCAFGTKLDSLGKEDDPFVTHAKEMLSNENIESPLMISMFIMPEFLRNLFGNQLGKMFRKTIDFYEKVVNQIISERNNSPSQRGDFLDVLLEEKRKAEEGTGEELSLKQKSATNDVIAAQSILFFLAGYDTTAGLLTWVTYELAVHPEIQEKVYEEIVEKFKEHGGYTADMIGDLPYLEMVINETFRHQGVAIRLERECTKPIEYDGLKIEKGMMIKIPSFAIHHNEDIYPEPDKFIPERFTPEEKGKRDQFAFLPFGQGPRNCVAMRFALEEAKVALVHVLHNLRFKTTPETKVVLYKGLLFNMPKNLKLGIEVR